MNRRNLFTSILGLLAAPFLPKLKAKPKPSRFGGVSAYWIAEEPERWHRVNPETGTFSDAELVQLEKMWIDMRLETLGRIERTLGKRLGAR